VLGGLPASRTHFLRLICGKERPEKGEILTQTRFSIIGNSGTYFHPGLTGLENITFCARRYGIDAWSLTKMAVGFEKIEADWPALTNKLPVKKRRAMEILVSALLPYDCYLLDDIDQVPPAMLEPLFEIIGARRAGVIFTARTAKHVRQFGDCGGVIGSNTLQMFSQVEEALALHG
jgi:capsular polysaccharide transport system ATP-binding protein